MESLSPVVQDCSEQDQQMLEHLLSLHQRSIGLNSRFIQQVYRRMLDLCPPEQRKHSHTVIVEKLRTSYNRKLEMAERTTLVEVKEQLVDSARFERIVMIHVTHTYSLLYRAYKQSLTYEKQLAEFLSHNEKSLSSMVAHLDGLSRINHVYAQKWQESLKLYIDQIRVIRKQTKKFAERHQAWSATVQSILTEQGELSPEQARKLDVLS